MVCEFSIVYTYTREDRSTPLFRAGLFLNDRWRDTCIKQQTQFEINKRSRPGFCAFANNRSTFYG